MAGRWRDPAAFRADASAAPAVRPSRRQAVALLVVLVLVAGATALASFLIRPDRARAFDLLHGSMYLQDAVAPVAVDLASGRPTVKLLNAQDLVDLKNAADVQVVPLTGGTLLLNPSNGTFNLLDTTGFVLKSDGGVPLPPRAGSHSMALAGDASAYIVQAGGNSGTGVYLVDAATVARAAAGTTAVKPRASISMPDASAATPGSAATADGDLWLLVGEGNSRKIRRLVLPTNSNPGVTLASTDRGTTPALSAIGTATTTRGTVVGVASAGRIQLFRGDTDVKSVPFPRMSNVSRILPVSGASGRLAFLALDGSTWKFVSVGADGTGLHAPTELKSVAPGAALIAPAESNGVMYTMDTDSRELFTIGENGNVGPLDGTAKYPEGEANVDKGLPYDDAYIIARDSRVVFNSPKHRQAVVAFTDSSRAPLVIKKSEGVGLNANAGALEVAKANLNPATPGKKSTKPEGSKPQKTPVEPINNTINCNTAAQRPHTPVITTTVPASRSVQVSWIYPTTSTSDCVPTTWIIGVTQKGSSAPSPRTDYRIDANTSANVTGLFPSTSYAVTVTGFINGLSGPPSTAALITTGAEGPAAPTNVLASTDSAGNWTVTWASCGSAKSGCVPTNSWKVIPEFCDGRGLSTPPDSFLVGADPSSLDQPPGVLHGGDALLGRGLRFQVEGIGEQGTIGRPSGFTACTYSWSPPVAADIAVTASTPPQTTGQDTTTTTVSVRLQQGAVHDLGGIGGSLTYKLLDSNGAVVTSNGPTASLSQTLNGVRAGASYSVAVVATPPRHPEAAVTIGPVTVQPAIAVFPAPTVSATFENTSFSDGRLVVSYSFPAGTDTHGETFDLVNSTLTCGGSTSKSLSYPNTSPGQNLVFDGIDRFTYNSTGSPCNVTLQLAQNSATTTSPPLYGAAISRTTTTAVTIPQPTLTTSAGDFQAQWSGTTGQPQVLVTYHGNDHLLLASGWTITVTNGTTADCGTSHNAPTATVDVNKSCVRDGGTFTVSVDYTYLLSNQHFAGIPVSGTAPQPVDTSKIDYKAAWGGDVTNPLVTLTYTGSQDTSTFDTFTWSETVTSDVSPGVTCGSSTASADQSVSIGVDLTLCPSTAADGTKANYSVEVKFHDPNYGVDFDKSYLVSGVPPA
ncbi:MAG TPA: fibronectin type III domain-containing protein [Jatrophihabitans sp.]|uniref:fibronectin type III domain-containing protein n=1 Tax=Jatrophihabitans sp. TaxID=1932789 RepID=UPI002E04AE30|nr:fibronectin type III domain-containing protein [Jatrophihabitans sp.]